MGAEGEIAASGFVRRELIRVARRVWLTQAAYGLCWWLVAVGAMSLGLFLCDNLLHLPAAARLIAGVAALAVGVHLLWRRVAGPLRARWSPERAARLLERSSGRGDNLLINACCFEAAELGVHEQTLSAPIVQSARAIMRATSLMQLCRVPRLMGWLLGSVLMVAAWGFYHWVSPERFDNAFERFALPLADVPALGSVRLTIDPDHDLVLSEGETMSVHVSASSGSGAGVPTPYLLWMEAERSVPADGAHGERMPMTSEQGRWVARFANVRRSFALRVFCADSCTRSLHVTVSPLPRLTTSQIVVTPPAYVAGAATPYPGPPATLEALSGSQVRLSIHLDQTVSGVVWRLGGRDIPCTGAGDTFSASATIVEAGPSALVLPDGRIIASGAVVLQSDAPPEVTLSGLDENRMLLPGTSFPLEVVASDDHGLRACGLQLRDGDSGSALTIKAWQYLGPPGPATSHEHWTLVLDPERFQGGHSYVLQAVAGDYALGGHLGHSRAVVLRIKTLSEITSSDPQLESAIEALKEAISREREAVGLCDNLAPALQDAIAGGRLESHRAVIATQQHAAQDAGRKARQEFTSHGELPSAHALSPIVEGEMSLALEQIAGLPSDAGAAAHLAALQDRQQVILNALIALLGEVVERSTRHAANPDGTHDAPDAMPSAHDAAEKALNDLQDFVREQSRILERTRSLMDAKPLDLSDTKAAVLGELSREEAKQAKYLEEKLTDFSKLPTQDFADGSLDKEINQVWQDVNAADAALYKKAIEMAVPQEQSGLELAKELENNLEKWMANHPDNVQWKMEEALAPADVPVSELPKQLEDIVGDLLDKEDAMQPDVEDFSSAWMDNIDKGAGWDAGDGPISNMSAKGITGNQLPNQNEIGGRSGEGRNGRSHGQMVQDTAEGKGGRETPSRLDPEPFESGSVKDSAKDDQGGPTGGGKVSGYAQEGLRGPVPPPLSQAMVRLAGNQAQVRQAAGTLALELRRRHLPSGEIENAVHAMQGLEDAARRGDGGAIHQRFTEAVDALRAQRAAVSDAPASLRHERIDLSTRARDLQQGASAGIPAGYEEMSSQYFKAMAEDGK